MGKVMQTLIHIHPIWAGVKDKGDYWKLNTLHFERTEKAFFFKRKQISGAYDTLVTCRSLYLGANWVCYCIWHLVHPMLSSAYRLFSTLGTAGNCCMLWKASRQNMVLERKVPQLKKRRIKLATIDKWSSSYHWIWGMPWTQQRT